MPKPFSIFHASMPSLRFLLRALMAPWLIAKITLQYYTVGTIYTQTDPEFRGSLLKNIVVGTAAFLSEAMSPSDASLLGGPLFSYFAEFKDLEGARGLPHYGETVARDKSFAWFARPEGAKKALLYFHGGAYVLPLARTQFVGMMGVWWGVSPKTRGNLAIAILDYLLTSQDFFYPTQIFEAVRAYRQLVDLGYEVVLMGDSAGANLALAVARFVANLGEAEAHFSRFSEFAWDFRPVSPPRTMVLIAPWVQLENGVQEYPGVNHEGEYISYRVNQTGLFYVDGHGGRRLNRQDVAHWVDFNTTSFDHWAKVPAFVDGAVLYIYGEREYLRKTQEEFVKKMGKNFTTYLQPGGIHDTMFVAEALGFRLKKGMASMVAGDHREKYNYGAVCRFLDEHV